MRNLHIHYNEWIIHEQGFLNICFALCIVLIESIVRRGAYFQNLLFLLICIMINLVDDNIYQ